MSNSQVLGKVERSAAVPMTCILTDALSECLTSDFYSHLFSYFMTLDISNFNPRQIPHTEERQTLLEANKSVYELFVDETDFVSLDCLLYTSPSPRD